MSSVISLTPRGAELAKRIAELFPALTHRHKPEPFADTVQELFLAGEGLILICATGIAVRVLAPVLKSKHYDPAVLVLDEQGQFVVPLLSGHEGGANEWARVVAERLGAQAVLTTASPYTRPLWVAGIGCERGCPMEVIEELLQRTVLEYSGELTALATIDIKQDEEGMLALAEKVGLELAFYSAEVLRTAEDRLTQHSDHVFKATGCYGVAEAAALIHAERLAGRKAELVAPKRKNAQATVALARAYQDIKDD